MDQPEAHQRTQRGIGHVRRTEAHAADGQDDDHVDHREETRARATQVHGHRVPAQTSWVMPTSRRAVEGCGQRVKDSRISAVTMPATSAASLPSSDQAAASGACSAYKGEIREQQRTADDDATRASAWR